MSRSEKQYPLLIIPGMCDMGLGALQSIRIAARLDWKAHFVPLKQDLGELSNMSFQGYVEKVKSFEMLRRYKSVLIGHSLGGLIALKVAEECPDRVAAVILLESAPPKGIPPLTIGTARRALKYTRHLACGRPFQPCRDDIEALWLNRVSPEKKEGLLRSYVKESGLALREILFGISIDPKKIRAPVLVAGGEYDQMLPLQIQRKIAEMFGRKLIVLPHGHQPMHEAGWEESLEKLLDQTAILMA